MEAECGIKLFGGLRVTVGGEAIARFPTQKAGLLLAYLALAPGKPRTREHLIELLWPDMEPDAGRNNLSTLLSMLRRALKTGDTSANSILQADRHSVVLNSDCVETDVAEFARLRQCAARTANAETRCQIWQEAACLVKGELLPECYEEWALQARTRYAAQYEEILRQRAALLLVQGRYEEVVADTAQALQANPCDETACQLQMRAFAATGRSHAALQAYARLEHDLQTRLQTMPDAATRVLKDRIRSNPEIFVAPAPDENIQSNPSGMDASLPAPYTLPTTKEAIALPNFATASTISAPENFAKGTKTYACCLPVPLTRFFGREREQEELLNMLRTPDTRLITLLGAGGAGKTRLALEVGRQAVLCFQERVWFVALADIPDPALIPMRLLTALNLSLPNSDPLQTIIAALAPAPSLLILDNMEHLLWEEDGLQAGTKAENPQLVGAQMLIRRLLEALPNLTCLATSRHALHLEGEQEYALPPLATPAKEEKEKRRKGEEETGNRKQPFLIPNTQYPTPDSSFILPPSSFASVALYVDRAQKAKSDFVLTPRNADAVAELCRTLEGMPLAIEMAAAWIKTVPPARMLERLEHQLEMLVSRRRDLPTRQQSLRATCEWSYSLLSPELQQAFRRLSVFRGGWTAEAADALNPHPSTSLHLLAELQERSLILSVEADSAEGDKDAARYRMLEPLREFGREKLKEAGESDSVERRHAHWFRNLAADGQTHYRAPQESAYLAALKTEQDNLRAALEWYRRKASGEGLGFAADLCRYWELSGNLAEGRQWLGDMLALPTSQKLTPERARALCGSGVLAMLQADYPDAEARYREAQTLFSAFHHLPGQADALHGLGNVAFYEQNYEQARACYEQSHEIRLAVGEEAGIASSCHSLGNLEARLENYECAHTYLERAVSLRRKRRDENGVTQTLGAMGQLACRQGQYNAALTLFCEILQMFHKRGIACSVALCLRDIAEVFWYQGERRQVVCFMGASHALRDATGFPLPPAEREIYAQELGELRTELGEPEFERMWGQGYAMTAEQAVTHALYLVRQTGIMIHAKARI